MNRGLLAAAGCSSPSVAATEFLGQVCSRWQRGKWQQPVGTLSWSDGTDQMRARGSSLTAGCSAASPAAPHSHQQLTQQVDLPVVGAYVPALHLLHLVDPVLEAM